MREKLNVLDPRKAIIFMGYAHLASKSIPQLQKHIRAIANDTAVVFITVHASARMRQRRVTRQEVFEVLRQGVIRQPPEPEAAKGTLLCRMTHYIAGRNLAAVVALNDEHPNVVVVTVMLIG